MIGKVSTPFRQRAMRRVSPETADLMELGSRRRWRPRVVGRATLLTDPVFLGDWWLVPVEQDTSPIPKRASDRVQAIFEAGLRPKGFVVAHEAPALLPAPASAGKPRRRRIVELRRLLSKRVVLGVGAAVLLVLFGPMLLKLLVTAIVGLVAAVATPLLAIGALGAVVLVDPVLIAVTEDGFWVEIDRWMS